MNNTKKIIPLALLSIYSFANNSWADENRSTGLNLSPVVVTGTRIEQNSFDLPMSINSISADTISGAQQQVHLSESAARIPGIVINNRNHGAQELSISSRGFGPRSQFYWRLLFFGKLCCGIAIGWLPKSLHCAAR